jgi:hypothetical protein
MSSLRLDFGHHGRRGGGDRGRRGAESSLDGYTAFSQADLEDKSSDLDLEQDVRVVRDGDRVVGVGLGTGIVTALAQEAAGHGARRIQNSVMEGRLRGTRPARVARLHPRVRLARALHRARGASPAPQWPDGLHAVPFDPERDALELHAGHQEAFADHWEHTPRDFRVVVEGQPRQRALDPTLWCVVRAGDEIAAGTLCTGGTYGGGFIHALSRVARGRQAWARRS